MSHATNPQEHTTASIINALNANPDMALGRDPLNRRNLRKMGGYTVQTRKLRKRSRNARVISTAIRTGKVVGFTDRSGKIRALLTPLNDA